MNGSAVCSEGFMEKKSRKGVWQRRHFELTVDGVLSYAKSSPGTTCTPTNSRSGGYKLVQLVSKTKVELKKDSINAHGVLIRLTGVQRHGSATSTLELRTSSAVSFGEIFANECAKIIQNLNIQASGNHVDGGSYNSYSRSNRQASESADTDDGLEDVVQQSNHSYRSSAGEGTAKRQPQHFFPPSPVQQRTPGGRKDDRHNSSSGVKKLPKEETETPTSDLLLHYGVIPAILVAVLFEIFRYFNSNIPTTDTGSKELLVTSSDNRSTNTGGTATITTDLFYDFIAPALSLSHLQGNHF